MIRTIRPAMLLAMLFAGGCVNSISVRAVPDADVSRGRTFYVQTNPKESHGIDILLRDELRKWGRRASRGKEGEAPAGTDVLVTYHDHWYWDLRMYLLQLDVEFRDPATKEVVASAVKKRGSLDAKAPDYMVWEALVGIFGKTNPDEKPPPDPGQRETNDEAGMN